MNGQIYCSFKGNWINDGHMFVLHACIGIATFIYSTKVAIWIIITILEKQTTAGFMAGHIKDSHVGVWAIHPSVLMQKSN